MIISKNLKFSLIEIAEALALSRGLRDGVWELVANYGLSATNVGESMDDLKPSAIVLLLSLELRAAERETSLTIDASKLRKGKRR